MRARPSRPALIGAVIGALIDTLGVASIPVGLAVPAAGQEAEAGPLFLRIRPQGAPEAGLGAGGLSDAEVAQRARAAREAVWERSRRNAERVIASVCTGCLTQRAARSRPESAPATPGPAAPEVPRSDATAVASLSPDSPATARAEANP